MSSRPSTDPPFVKVDDIFDQSLTVSKLHRLFEMCKTLSDTQVEEVGKRFYDMTVQLHEPSDFEVLTTLLKDPDFSNAVKNVEILIDIRQYHKEDERIEDYFQRVMRGIENAMGLKTLRIEVVGPEKGFTFSFGTLSYATLEEVHITNGTTELDSLVRFLDDAPELRQFTAENLCITDSQLGSIDPPQVTGCRASDVLRQETDLEHFDTVELDAYSEWIRRKGR
ncbi:hypothetical protein CERZMDRAFT_98821 [Cercospora zeae-maydis SCOH1-5]|uniref:Uncharacterized protein n=1 Tax=Cercospora zeae-maydis SCOH1-5 TaxID=717836 RepID=A0A6A6FCC2_9PEZI|nr:hypothetical protein CERZMDRAFT_98821 [Cercospora zeae-maydis SCOH1-5]